jgi:hypothetical protein
VATPDWHTLADIGGFVGVVATFVGFGMKQAKARGIQEQDLKNMQEVVMNHAKAIKDHETRLADGSGNFKEVNAKLDSIAVSQVRIEEKLDRHIERSVK